MKPKIKLITYGGLLLFFCLSAFAQGTAFTYQGRLNNGSNPANGSYDLAFTLFATNATGVAIAGPVTNSAVSVTSGLFTTTVNFGNAFIGGSNWLQIAVSTNGANAFSTLLPRQQLTPVPYAVLAENVSGVISAAQLPNGLGGVNNGASGSFATVSGGNFNDANGSWATVSGGDVNTASGIFSTVSGGRANNVGQQGATVAGGENNTASGLNSTVGGGLENTASGQNATVAGGGGNIASGNVATVAGGYGNTASGLRSYAAGTQAQALNDGAFVWADSQLLNFSSTNNDSFNVRAQGGARFVTSGAGMTVDGQSVLTTGSVLLGLSIQQNSNGAPNVILGSSVNFVSGGVVGATIGGGGTTNYFGSPYTNSVTADFGMVGGGYQNTASGEGSTVAGGVDNTASGIQAMVGGGYGNTASGDSSTVAGGDYSIASGNSSFAAGTQAQALNDGAFVWADSQSSGFSSTNNDSFNVLAHGGARFVTGGAGMTVDGQPVLTTGSSIPLPDGLGGSGNTTSGQHAIVAGGFDNAATAAYGTIGGGFENAVNGNWATVGGGANNVASGFEATVAGGYDDIASGDNSFAAGRRAMAKHTGTFVWADSTDADFASTSSNQFLIRASGGVGIGTTMPTTALQVNGVVTANSFSGSAGGLTGLSATAITGTVADANLSANVALLNRSTQNFTGSVNTFSGNIGIGTTTPNSALSVYGNIFMGKQRNNTTFNQVGDTIYLGAEQKYLGNTLGTPVNGSTDWINLMANSLSAGIIFGLSTSTANPHSNNIPLMVIQSNGNVGIGTTTPAAGLDVETAPTGVNHGNWGYLQQPGYTAGPLGGSPNLDIYTSGAIGASTYYAFSDERIKNIIGVSSSAKDLNTLMAIHVTDYTYKDTVIHGNGPVKKVIAQQVESVYPQAVSQTTGVIPDIYKQAAVKEGWVQLATSLKVGEKVKLIGESGQGIYQVLEVRLGEFRTDFKTDTDHVFVFGRQVDDFRNVDYEALSTLNISATQELTRKLEAESSEVSALKQELAEMKKLVAQLARDNQETQLADKPTPQTRATAGIRKPLLTAGREN